MYWVLTVGIDTAVQPRYTTKVTNKEELKTMSNQNKSLGKLSVGKLFDCFVKNNTKEIATSGENMLFTHDVGLTEGGSIFYHNARGEMCYFELSSRPKKTSILEYNKVTLALFDDLERMEIKLGGEVFAVELPEEISTGLKAHFDCLKAHFNNPKTVPLSVKHGEDCIPTVLKALIEKPSQSVTATLSQMHRKLNVCYWRHAHNMYLYADNENDDVGYLADFVNMSDYGSSFEYCELSATVSLEGQKIVLKTPHHIFHMPLSEYQKQWVDKQLKAKKEESKMTGKEFTFRSSGKDYTGTVEEKHWLDLQPGDFVVNAKDPYFYVPWTIENVRKDEWTAKRENGDTSTQSLVGLKHIGYVSEDYKVLVFTENKPTYPVMKTLSEIKPGDIIEVEHLGTPNRVLVHQNDMSGQPLRVEFPFGVRHWLSAIRLPSTFKVVGNKKV